MRALERDGSRTVIDDAVLLVATAERQLPWVQHRNVALALPQEFDWQVLLSRALQPLGLPS